MHAAGHANTHIYLTVQTLLQFSELERQTVALVLYIIQSSCKGKEKINILLHMGTQQDPRLTQVPQKHVEASLNAERVCINIHPSL